jgi:hypothetical protein
LISVLLNIDFYIVLFDSHTYSLSVLISLGLQLLTVWLWKLIKSLTREAFLELTILYLLPLVVAAAVVPLWFK